LVATEIDIAYPQKEVGGDLEWRQLGMLSIVAFTMSVRKSLGTKLGGL